MVSFKFVLVATCLLVACEALGDQHNTPVDQANPSEPTEPTHGDEQTTNTKRDKKDVLLSTIAYPYVQPATSLLNTVYPISAVSPISAIQHPYHRTVYPYSSHYPYYPYSSYYPYYPYSSYYPYYHNSVYYLRK